ncbi:MAG: hypothetical protein RDU76_10970 [Candidatus Edwardsbacteria bacterium]|nr:hypothetical protein [Candidatus Edwardsbacteria bacterium]
MKQTFTPRTIIFLLLAISAFTLTAHSQSLPAVKYLYYYPTGGITNNINLNDSTSASIIDRYNDYNYQTSIINSFKDLADHYCDRIRFELQLGPGLLHRFQANDPYRDSAYLFLSFKVNLMNPKLPQPQYVINKSHALKNYLAGRQYVYRDDMLKRAQEIEDAVNEYQSHFWWKRISLGISIPVYANHPGGYGDLEWYSDRVSLFAGYDIGDIGTFQLGVSTDRSVYTSLSADVSTPLYLLSERAISTLTRMLGVSRAGSPY